jgi:lipopolysaccharide export LptBFGC system permease protein LptF
MHIFVDPAVTVRGIGLERVGADRASMIWPVAALAVFLLAFVIVYGTVLQSRVESALRGRMHEDSGVETDIA